MSPALARAARLPPALALALALGLALTLGSFASAVPVVPTAPGSAEKEALYSLTLAPGLPDYFLPAPAGSPGQTVRLVLDARRAAPKSRVMFLQPLAAGRRRLHIEVRGARADQTFVVALPFAPGRSVLNVEIAGQGRFDLGFFAQGDGVPPREYRFTRRGPLPPESFTLDIPAAQR